MADCRETLGDCIETALLRSLFSTTAPLVIMSAGFAAAGIVMWDDAHDPILLALTIIGTLASLLRIAFVFAHRREVLSDALTDDRARTIGTRFAATYMAFAVALGAWGARAFASGNPQEQMLTCVMLVGYAAGSASTVGLIPRIAAPSMVVAVLPTVLTALAVGEPLYTTTAVMMTALLAGGLHTVRMQSRTMRIEIAQRIAYATMARHDSLTGLPNRLGLFEWFEQHVARQRAEGLVAVHCLDLDGFKQVNDRYGHPVGDALLRALATRLRKAVRGHAIVARLGGDEFAIIQRGLFSAGEPELMAQRVRRAVERPFDLDAVEARISISVGYVVADGVSSSLDRLIALADEALYEAKHSRNKAVGLEAGEPTGVLAA